MPSESLIEPETEVKEIPFPIEALPDNLRLIVEEVCEGYDCGHGMFSLPMLVVMSAAIGNSHVLALTPSWKVKPAIWGAIVAGSGAGKSQPAGEAVKPLKLIDQLFEEINQEEWTKYDKAKASYEKQKTTLATMISRFTYGTTKMPGDPAKAKQHDEKLSKLKAPEKPMIRQVCVGDTTQEALVDTLDSNPRGCVVFVDEIANFLGGIGRYSGAERCEKAFYNGLYEGERIRVNRKGRLPLTVDNPSCAVFGTIQPMLVDTILNQEDKNSGFAARLMLCRVPKTWRSFNQGGVPAETRKRYSSLIDEIWRICPTGRANDYSQPIECQVSPELVESYIQVHNETQRRLMKASGFAESLEAKCRTFTLKLALIFHVAENRSESGSRPVTAETLNNAYKLARYFVNQALDIDMTQRIGANDSEVITCLDWLATNGGSSTARAMQRGNKRVFADMGEIKPIIDYMVVEEFVEVKKVSVNGVGRKSELVSMTEYGNEFILSHPEGVVSKEPKGNKAGFTNKKPR